MPTERPRVIGVDFDNTLVCYDTLFRQLAEERQLIAPHSATAPGLLDKRAVRDAVRQLPGGEVHWQRLQAAAYGPRIGAAELAPEADLFLARCAQDRLPVHIVSHKTERSPYDEVGCNLRDAARGWMQSAGLFHNLGLTPAQVHFGATRHEKIALIRQLGCTHFIDDLPEVFAEPEFPADVVRILYQPVGDAATEPGVIVLRHWREIREYLFHD